jgi:hypothetical protein
MKFTFTKDQVGMVADCGVWRKAPDELLLKLVSNADCDVEYTDDELLTVVDVLGRRPNGWKRAFEAVELLNSINRKRTGSSSIFIRGTRTAETSNYDNTNSNSSNSRRPRVLCLD